jgi:hypothetical protein
MDTGFWTRLHGRLRHAALALGPEGIEELAAHAQRARAEEGIPRSKTRRQPPRNHTARAGRPRGTKAEA